VRIIDIINGDDVRLVKYQKVYGVLAAPDCTHLASCGAWKWEEKGDEALIEALALVDACLRIAFVSNPVFWCLENPVGRLTKYLGPPVMYFNPCDYGDPYTKKSALWGKFNIPKTNPVEPTEGSKMYLLPPSKDRKALRSITPTGFAKAFFEANR